MSSLVPGTNLRFRFYPHFFLMLKSVTIGLNTNLTMSGKFEPVLRVTMLAGELHWDIIGFFPTHMLLWKEILTAAKKNGESLADVREMFSNPHASLQVIEIEEE